MAKIIKGTTEVHMNQNDFDSIAKALNVLRQIYKDLESVGVDVDDIFELDLDDNEKLLLGDLERWVSGYEDVKLIVEEV